MKPVPFRSLLAVAPLALAVACTTTDPAASGPPLPSDAYFTGVPSQYASVDECLAHSTHPYGWDCAFELALCHTGRAGLRTGDVITDGTYHVDAGLARGTIDHEAFEFDVESATELKAGFGDGLTWHADVEGRWMTLQWDVISCDH